MIETPVLLDISVLMVEDNSDLAAMTANHLQQQGAKVHIASTLNEGSTIYSKVEVDLVLLDLQLPDGLGTELLAELHNKDPELPVIMLTQFANVRTAVESMKKGAIDFLEKPFRYEDLDIAVARAMTMNELRREIRQLQRAALTSETAMMHSNNATMKAIWHQIDTLAPIPSNILITGENGTGKEVIARALHNRSLRAKKPFIAVNCSGLTETLIEDRLLGHEPGAFTDGRTLHRGDFELAHEGTIFLDEIGDMPVKLQTHLLRVVEQRTFTRMGGEREIKVDIRLLAATNRNLEEAMEEGGFRLDLFYRLDVVRIMIPPLRERREDIPLLIAAFLRELGQALNKPRRHISASALQLLLAYNWPGNIRELRNAVENALIFCNGTDILPEHLPLKIQKVTTSISGPAPDSQWEQWIDAAPLHSFSLAETTELVERLLVLRALRQSGWHRRTAADVLGITDVLLNYRMKKHGITQEK